MKSLKKALEKLPGVVSASADYHTGVATLRASQPLESDVLKQAVEAEDYAVKAVSTL